MLFCRLPGGGETNTRKNTNRKPQILPTVDKFDLYVARDRYGDGAIDYTDFCQRIMFDQAGMEALANKISARFAELR